MKNLSLIIIFSTILSSCASLSDKARNLREIQSEEEAKGCFQVRKLTSTTSSNSIGGNMFVDHDAKVKLLNTAAEYGDTILFVKDQQNFTGIELESIVYDCLSLTEKARNLRIVASKAEIRNCSKTDIIEKSYSLNQSDLENLKTRIELYNEAAEKGDSLFIVNLKNTPSERVEAGVVFSCD